MRLASLRFDAAIRPCEIRAARRGVGEMHDAAFGIEPRRNQALAAEYRRDAEACLQRVEVTDAVQQWQGRGVRSAAGTKEAIALSRS
jgi:hypothetical protein